MYLVLFICYICSSSYNKLSNLSGLNPSNSFSLVSLAGHLHLANRPKKKDYEEPSRMFLCTRPGSGRHGSNHIPLVGSFFSSQPYEIVIKPTAQRMNSFLIFKPRLFRFEKHILLFD